MRITKHSINDYKGEDENKKAAIIFFLPDLQTYEVHKINAK